MRARPQVRSPRVSAEERLRGSERRQRLLLDLTDRLGAIDDADRIEEVVTRMLGEYIGADRVFYGLISDDGDTCRIGRDYHVDRVTSMAGDYVVAAYGPRLMQILRTGRTLVIPDVATESSLDERERSAYARLDIGAAIGRGIVRSGRWVAVLGVHQRTAREWTPEEVALVEEVPIAPGRPSNTPAPKSRSMRAKRGFAPS